MRSPVYGDFLSCLILLSIECAEEDLEFKGLKFALAKFDLDLSEGTHTIQVCQHKHRHLFPFVDFNLLEAVLIGHGIIICSLKNIQPAAH